MPGPAFGALNFPAAGLTQGSQIMEALGAMPAMEDQKLKMQQQKAETLKTQAEAETLEQTQARNQMQLYYRMLMNAKNANVQPDPKIYAAMEKTAQTLGIGSIMHHDPATGQSVVDMDALKSIAVGRVLTDLPETAIAAIRATPKEDRPAAIAAYGVDVSTVDPSILNAAAVLDPTKAQHMIDAAAKDLASFAAGTNDITSLKAQIDLQAKQLAKYGIDPSGLIEAVNSPQFAADMSRGLLAKTQLMQQAGFKDAAYTNYYNNRSAMIPFQIQNIQNQMLNRDTNTSIHQQAVDQAGQKAINDYTLKAQAVASGIKKNQAVIDHLAALNQSLSIGSQVKVGALRLNADRATIKGLSDQYNGLVKAMTPYINNPGHDIPQELLQSMSDINETLTTAQGTLDLYDQQVPQMTANHISAASGKPAKPAQMRIPGMPPGGVPGYFGKGKNQKFGYQIGTGGSAHYYLLPSKVEVDKDGNPL